MWKLGGKAMLNWYEDTGQDTSNGVINVDNQITRAWSASAPF